MKSSLLVRISAAVFLAAAFLIPAKTFAVDAIPNTSVWFTPSDAKAGTTIDLNALVYNNQPQDATVTVLFKNDKTVIGTQTQLIASQSAKTLVQHWIMPSKSTVVTVAVTGAVNSKKASMPALLGTLGTMTMGGGVTAAVPNVSFPGSTQLTAWFGPLLSKIETFRIKQAASYAILRDKTKASVGISNVKMPTTATDGLPPLKFDNPLQYAVVIYATAFAAFFGNAIVFYIGVVLTLLLVIRFFVNLLT